jgi:hypothetical protein
MPKSQIATNVRESFLVILWLGSLFGKLTFWRLTISPSTTYFAPPLRIIYIGERYTIMPAIMASIMQAAATLIVLALATLGDVTQIGLFLFMSLRPRWPRQVLFHVPDAGNSDSIIA